MNNLKIEITERVEKCEGLLKDFLPTFTPKQEILELNDKTLKKIADANDFAGKVNNKVLTIENYIEKYLPLSLMRTLYRIIFKCFSDHKRDKLTKYINRFALEMQEGILTDLGKGSIFENIQKHNQFMIDNLKLQIDLTEKDLIDKRSKCLLTFLCF